MLPEAEEQEGNLIEVSCKVTRRPQALQEAGTAWIVECGLRLRLLWRKPVIDLDMSETVKRANLSCLFRIVHKQEMPRLHTR